MPYYLRWTKEEIKTLETNFTRLGPTSQTEPVTRQTLLDLLPTKSWGAIKWKANQLNLERDFKLAYPPLNLSRFDTGYIAGLTDGEGCISISKNKRKNRETNLHPYISIANTDLDVLNWITELTTLGSVRRLTPTPVSERTEKWHQRPWIWSKCYTWQTSSYGGCYRFLTDIGPYLKIKKRLAELVLEFLEIQHTKSKPRVEIDPQTGYFIKRITAERISREEDIYQEVKKLNHRP